MVFDFELTAIINLFTNRLSLQIFYFLNILFISTKGLEIICFTKSKFSLIRNLFWQWFLIRYSKFEKQKFKPSFLNKNSDQIPISI